MAATSSRSRSFIMSPVALSTAFDTCKIVFWITCSSFLYEDDMVTSSRMAIVALHSHIFSAPAFVALSLRERVSPTLSLSCVAALSAAAASADDGAAAFSCAASFRRPCSIASSLLLRATVIFCSASVSARRDSTANRELSSVLVAFSTSLLSLVARVSNSFSTFCASCLTSLGFPPNMSAIAASICSVDRLLWVARARCRASRPVRRRVARCVLTVTGLGVSVPTFFVVASECSLKYTWSAASTSSFVAFTFSFEAADSDSFRAAIRSIFNDSTIDGASLSGINCAATSPSSSFICASSTLSSSTHFLAASLFDWTVVAL